MADKNDGKVRGIFDIHVINVYLTNARSSAWVFDTGSVAIICNSKQGLRIKRRLAKDKVTMRVGNGSKVDVIAVGTLPLHLPSRLVLDINNCYLVPALSMNIISGSCLMRDGYSFKSENNGCSIYMGDYKGALQVSPKVHVELAYFEIRFCHSDRRRGISGPSR